MVDPPIFAYSEALLFWAIFIWSLVFEILRFGVKRGAPPGNVQDAGTLRRINVGSNIALWLALLVAWLPWLRIRNPRLALWVGTLVLLAGFLVRRHAMRALGKCFTAAVSVAPDQPLVQSGPYRWIRHPGYAGGFAMFLGIGLALGSWLSVLVFVIEILLVYTPRVRAEEKALVETIGEPYRAYMTRTKRFIPFVF